MPLISSGFLIIATKNTGKTREFADKFAPLGIQVRSLADYPDIPPIIEDGANFMDNAELKARAVATALGEPALADDSGLCVDALAGEPGIYSARYAGEHATDRQNIEKLLSRLHRAGAHMISPPHSDMPAPEGATLLSPAKFVCALALIDPRTNEWIRAEASCPGYIIDSPRGTGGFGYDPVFYLPHYGRTMAELTMSEKQAISHRGLALDKLLNRLRP